jgi:hypothetical protein
VEATARVAVLCIAGARSVPCFISQPILSRLSTAWLCYFPHGFALSQGNEVSGRVVGDSEVGPLLLRGRPAFIRDWAGLGQDSGLHPDLRNHERSLRRQPLSLLQFTDETLPLARIENLCS